ncbi:unnamed protein product, partial [Phaeothamnion confervicola]
MDAPGLGNVEGCRSFFLAPESERQRQLAVGPSSDFMGATTGAGINSRYPDDATSVFPVATLGEKSKKPKGEEGSGGGFGGDSSGGGAPIDCCVDTRFSGDSSAAVAALMLLRNISPTATERWRPTPWPSTRPATSAFAEEGSHGGATAIGSGGGSGCGDGDGGGVVSLGRRRIWDGSTYGEWRPL